MTFPGWTPKWVRELWDCLAGTETVMGLKCRACGRRLQMSDHPTQEEADALVLAHDRFFHPERLTPKA